MPPVVKFGAPIWRHDHDDGVWIVPVIVRSWFGWGPASLDEAEVYLEEWAGWRHPDPIRSVQMGWGDITETGSEKTVRLRPGKGQSVSIMRVPANDRPIVTDLKNQRTQKPSEIQVGVGPTRYTLRVTSGRKKWRSPEAYCFYGKALFAEKGAIENYKRKLTALDVIRALAIGALGVFGLWYLLERGIPSTWNRIVDRLPPTEGTAADPVIHIDQVLVHKRENDVPFYVNVYWHPEKAVISWCLISSILTPAGFETPSEIDANFALMRDRLTQEVLSGNCTKPESPKLGKFFTLFPHEYLNDQTVSDVEHGRDRDLHVNVSWLYRTRDSNQWYIEEFCVISLPDTAFGQWRYCDPHNRAYAHKVHS